MQQTRDRILRYLKQHGAATVDELAGVLRLTPVTVRHHLDVLRSQELVGEPAARRRATPGRPQYAYSLTDKASTHFPKNYCALAGQLLLEARQHAPGGDVSALLQGVAERMASACPPPAPGEALVQRLQRATAFLNERDYMAHWEPEAGGGVLHICNCPYEVLAGEHAELCSMDAHLLGHLLGAPPTRLSRIVEGATSCSFFLPATQLIQPFDSADGD